MGFPAGVSVGCNREPHHTIPIYLARILAICSRWNASSMRSIAALCTNNLDYQLA